MNDLPVLSLSDGRQLEGDRFGGDELVEFTVSLSAPSTADVTYQARTLSGSADQDIDFDRVNGTFTIPAGETTQTFSVRTDNDDAVEGDESFVLQITDVTGAVLAGGARSLEGLGIIVDDDGDNRTALFAKDVRIVEGTGASEAVIPVTLSRPLDVAIEVPFVTVANTARAGRDFTAVSGVLRFEAGETESSVSVPLLGDMEIEGTERFSVLFDQAGLGFVDGDRGIPATVELLDDDAGGGTLPVLSLSDGRQLEGDRFGGDELVEFTVSLSAPSTADVTYQARTLSGSADQDIDFDRVNGTFTIPAGETTQTFSVRTDNDDAVEGDESFVLQITDVTGAVLAGGARSLEGLGIIVDDDGDNRTALFAKDVRIVEGTGGNRLATTDVALSRPLDVPVILRYSTTQRDGAAADIVASTGRLVFEPGEVKKSIAVRVVGDTAPEVRDIAIVALAVETDAPLADGGGGIGIEFDLVDDDTGGGTLPVLSLSDGRQLEGDRFGGDELVEFTVSLSALSTADVTYQARTLSGSADQDIDFDRVNGTFTIPAGETTQTFSVRTDNDDFVEGDESFILEISNILGAVGAGGNTVSATGTILDDDGGFGQLPALIVENAGVDEATGNAIQFTVRSQLPAGLTISGTYQVYGGTATAGADFAVSQGTFQILGGSTSTTILVPIVRDSLAEGTETVVLALSNIRNAGTGNSSEEIWAIGYITESLSFEEAKTVALLYEAGLNRDGNIDFDGLNFWIDQRERGLSAEELAENFLRSAEFEAAFGAIDSLSDRELVEQLYRNVLNREGDAGGIDFWTAAVGDPNSSRGQLLTSFSISNENASELAFIDTLTEVAPGEWDFVS